jgi:hypothetical protein
MKSKNGFGVGGKGGVSLLPVSSRNLAKTPGAGLRSLPMTNSERKRAEAIIEDVFEKIGEEYFQLRIDEPIEKAAASFEFDRTAPVTHQRFTQVTRDFVRHVYVKALWGWQKMPPQKALAEAVAILEERYQSAHSRGYYAAFLDASNPNLFGLESVLAQMARHITEKARARHIRWVCASRIELAEWPTRCLIAEILLARWKPFLPENILQCSAAQLANHITELITVGLSANRMVNKMLNSDPSFSGF